VPNSKSKDAYKQGIISILVNSLLFIAKYYAGIVSGSVALVTDAWHTISDSGSSLVLIIGTKLAHKPADEEHPYGHGRIELITALIIGIMLTLIGFNFLSSAINKLIYKETAVFGMLAIGVTIASILLNEGLAQYAFYLAKKSKNASIKADGWHHRSDALSSLILLIGILIGQHWWWIDGALGIIMAGFIFYAGYGIFKDVINPLIGQQPPQEMVEEVKRIATKIAGKEVSPHHFHVHQYGGHTELTFHIVLHGDLILSQADTLAGQIEKEISRTLACETTIHIDPDGEMDTIKDIEADKFK
jgi:cation diffusion facilitator family transporter